MNKKIVAILAVVVVVVAGALYFLVLNPDNEAQGPQIFEYWPGDAILANVGGTTNLMKAGVVLVVNSESALDVLEAGKTRIKDTVNVVLSSIDVEILLDGAQRDYVKQQIMDAVNERLEITDIVDVWFNDYVIQ
jgi:flagellar basal body-associated protein FliL